METMRVLDLFSGIGGFSLGLERAGMETVAFVEQDKACQKVLKKHWPDVPIYQDVRRFDGKQFRGTAELICGGVPCQPASQAGKRLGKTDDRWLWDETFRIVQDVDPKWCLFENVYGLLTLDNGMAFEHLCLALEAQNYEIFTFIIPACGLNAPHKRDRVWIIAFAEGFGYGRGSYQKCGIDERIIQQEERKGNPMGSEVKGCGSEWLSSNSIQFNDDRGRYDPGSVCGEQSKTPELSGGSRWWDVEPELGRVAYGVPNRVDRLKQLGNAVVPQIVEIIGKAIMEADKYEQ